MGCNDGMVLIVDHDSERARALATRLHDTGIVRFARHLADALVLVAIAEPDIVILRLGIRPNTRTSLTALRALDPDIEILFTGPFESDDTIESVLDEGACYMPSISPACIDTIIRRRKRERRQKQHESRYPHVAHR